MPRRTPRATSLERARATAQVRASADDQKLQYMSRRQVLDLIPVSSVTLWNWQRDGAFPRSRKVGGKAMWFRHEIEAWMLSRPIATLSGDST